MSSLVCYVFCGAVCLLWCHLSSDNSCGAVFSVLSYGVGCLVCSVVLCVLCGAVHLLLCLVSSVVFFCRVCCIVGLMLGHWS